MIQMVPILSTVMLSEPRDGKNKLKFFALVFSELVLFLSISTW